MWLIKEKENLTLTFYSFCLSPNIFDYEIWNNNLQNLQLLNRGDNSQFDPTSNIVYGKNVGNWDMHLIETLQLIKFDNFGLELFYTIFWFNKYFPTLTNGVATINNWQLPCDALTMSPPLVYPKVYTPMTDNEPITNK